MSLLIYPAPRPRRDRPFGGTVLHATPRGTACAGMRGPKPTGPKDGRPPGHPKQPSPPNPRDPDTLPAPKDGA